jgi:hypothetical protein
MRNFNAPLAAVLSAAAFVAGLPAAHAAEPNPTVKEILECARASAATAGSETTLTEISASSEHANFDLRVQQLGVMATKEGVSCIGAAGLDATLLLKAGSFTQVIDRGSVDITYTNEAVYSLNPVDKEATGGFPYAKACRAARQQAEANKSPTPPVRLLEYEERTYALEPGFIPLPLSLLSGPAPRTTRIARLACHTESSQ